MSDELRRGMESEGMSESWTMRYVQLLMFVRAQRDAAVAIAEGHGNVVLPLAPDYIDQSDLEMGERLIRLVESEAQS